MNRVTELRTWLESLPPRERLALLVGGAALALLLLYSALLHPFLTSKASLEAHVSQQQTLLAWMRPVAMQLQSLRAQQPASVPAGQSLLALVDKSAGDAGFGPALKQVQANPDGSIKVQLQAVGFDSLVRWLGALHQQYGISVGELTAQRGTGPGSVDATLTLTAPNP
jgi:general secretion pathway protein M